MKHQWKYQGLSRRAFLSRSSWAGALALFATTPFGGASAAFEGDDLLGFVPIETSTLDAVRVPLGYRAEVLISWGDRLFADSPAFGPANDAAAQSRQFGDNNDGMSFFGLSSHDAILAINHEYTNYKYLFHHHGKVALSAEDVHKAQAAHGVSLVTLCHTASGWEVRQAGTYNRRITAQTPCDLVGPAAGHRLLKTSQDLAGKSVLGTIGNCANGQTPWGTYLSCEENFDEYFGSLADARTDPRNLRYDLRPQSDRYRWYTHDLRFDLALEPNEPNRFGWIVEIDPMDPTSTPKKQTALGRFKHENAAVVLDEEGHVIVYMGDDEQGEHLYRFVSSGRYDPKRPQANRKLLEEGILSVAKFDFKKGARQGSGEWIDLIWGHNGLTPENGFSDQGEVLIFARQAASQVGATRMDRPEWVAVHPRRPHVYCTLTNNIKRGIDPDQPVGGPNPRAHNEYGQILRWYPEDGRHGASHFVWDLYVMAGNPIVHPDGPYAGSDNITKQNLFNAPDGLAFDDDGRLWILTDGNYSNTGEFAHMGNNQMLCGDPQTGEIRRFLTGPVGCEMTGIAFAPDYRSMFVGVQHPGEKSQISHWPDGGSHLPRSSVLRITREDGGIIGG
jgi:uncharacterized protein